VPDRPVAGQLEVRAAPDVEIDGRRLRGVIPYGVESRDMGGWREVMDAGCLTGSRMDDLTCRPVDHDGLPLGRFPATLRLEDRADGLHWDVDLPESRADIREAVERGDLRTSSWRMRVGSDRWEGDTRHIVHVDELRDVSLAVTAAYPAAHVEFRSAPEEGVAAMPEIITPPEAPPEAISNPLEARSAPDRPGLPVETATASSGRGRTLADEFRRHGFPGERAEVAFEDFEARAVTWTGSVDALNRVRPAAAADLGYDTRWIWPLFARIGVEEGATSVDVPTQTNRSLATPANVVRAVDATTTKPETGSTLTIVTTALKQLATKQSGVPNVFLESAALNAIVNDDLTLALNDALDSLVLAAIAGGGFQAPSTDNPYVSYRKAVTTLRGAGYNPNLLILTPAADEALDIMTSGVSGGTADFVNPPGQFGPDAVFGMARRVSKTIPAPAVVDTRALGKYYASRVSLARFEENAGATNTSLVRLETHAVFGLERQAAAVRVAAS
jgi:phage head maturation protease